jgi:hypothetical protein
MIESAMVSTEIAPDSVPFIDPRDLHFTANFSTLSS